MELALLLRDIALALWDSLRGRPRRRYEHAVAIRAPRRLVWDLMMSRDLTLDGNLMQVHAVIEPVPGRPGVDRTRIRIGTHELAMFSRTIEQREGIAELHEILVDGTHPSLVEGPEDYMGFALLDHADATILTLYRDAAPRSFLRRILLPLGLRGGARRYKRKAEHRAANAGAGAGVLP